MSELVVDFNGLSHYDEKIKEWAGLVFDYPTQDDIDELFEEANENE